MKMLFKVLLGVIFITCQFAYAQGADYKTTGENLERSLFKTVADQDWQSLQNMTSPEFQSLNADKIRTNVADALAYIKSLRFKSYDITDVAVTQSADGNTLVVTYYVNYKETVGGHPQAGKKTKNLSVWQKVNGQWQWVAHAVLD